MWLNLRLSDVVVEDYSQSLGSQTEDISKDQLTKPKIPKDIFFSVAKNPKWGHGRLAVEVFRSHTPNKIPLKERSAPR